ncbi:putative leader peptide [Streptomyces niveus]|uniref:putative leader peptide n=1 Tax=Streptomyces niveus TaxID=193462 RepID=UPI00371F2BFB
MPPVPRTAARRYPPTTAGSPASSGLNRLAEGVLVMVDHPLLTAVERLPMPRSQRGAYRLFLPLLCRVAQQPCNNPAAAALWGGARAMFPPASRIARILRFAYLCLVHPGVRLVSRIHVDLLRSASALCLQSHL